MCYLIEIKSDSPKLMGDCRSQVDHVHTSCSITANTMRLPRLSSSFSVVLYSSLDKSIDGKRLSNFLSLSITQELQDQMAVGHLCAA